MNKNGFVVKEVIILCAVLAIVFLIGITRVSFALEEIQDKDGIEASRKQMLLLAAEYYAQFHADEMQDETYIYGSDLIEAEYLVDVLEDDFENTKIRITKQNNEFHAEVVE